MSFALRMSFVKGWEKSPANALDVMERRVLRQRQKILIDTAHDKGMFFDPSIDFAQGLIRAGRRGLAEV